MTIPNLGLLSRRIARRYWRHTIENIWFRNTIWFNTRTPTGCLEQWHTCFKIKVWNTADYQDLDSLVYVDPMNVYVENCHACAHVHHYSSYRNQHRHATYCCLLSKDFDHQFEYSGDNLNPTFGLFCWKVHVAWCLEGGETVLPCRHQPHLFTRVVDLIGSTCILGSFESNSNW